MFVGKPPMSSPTPERVVIQVYRIHGPGLGVWTSSYLILLLFIFRTYGSGTKRPHYPPMHAVQRPGATAAA